MMKRTMLAVAVVLVGVLVAAPLWADAEYPPAEKQTKLDVGMPMEKVRALLGDPDSIDEGACFAEGSQPTQCRTWNYGKPGRLFKVVFRKDHAGWVVHSWSS